MVTCRWTSTDEQKMLRRGWELGCSVGKRIRLRGMLGHRRLIRDALTPVSRPGIPGIPGIPLTRTALWQWDTPFVYTPADRDLENIDGV